MPPDDTGEIPSDQERQDFIDWLTRIKFLSDKDPGVFVIRRLTKTEYGNTLRDLLGVNPQGVQELPDEVSGEGYLNSLSPLQLEHYLSIADRVLDQFFASDDVTDPEWKQQLFGEAPASASAARVAAGRIARSFCRKAYRRPPSEAEIGVMLDVFELGRQKDLDHRGAIRLMLKSALVSPQFLFITPAEVADPDAEIVPLDDHQLASRLSYFLWATMPDDELMSLADRGQLHEPHVLKAQAKRLLDDPRSGALFDGFATQWLGLGGWQDKVFDPSKFPQMTVELRASMHDEARLFFESVVREDRSVETFVDSDYTFLNESLAAVYGLQGTISGPAMRKVHLSDPNRGGVLGMPSVLAATSFPDRTSPVKRGVWVLEQLLGDHVPPAPPDVPALDEQDQQTADELTVRERIELHRQNPVCANCHRTLDPIGFGLENFDAIGRWRLKDDNGEWIDASGELPGGIDFSSPHELKSIVAGEVDKVSRNLYEKLLAYALCRKLEGYDEFVVEESMREIANGGYRMQTLITAVITSYPFTHRRIREALDPQ